MPFLAPSTSPLDVLGSSWPPIVVNYYRDAGLGELDQSAARTRRFRHVKATRRELAPVGASGRAGALIRGSVSTAPDLTAPYGKPTELSYGRADSNGNLIRGPKSHA